MDTTDQSVTNASLFSTNGSRPSSFYDNFRSNGQSDDSNGTNLQSGDTTKVPSEKSGEYEKESSPTQEFLLKTTVPQNLAAANIAGRHTPTRNSLRHSRMIVMNRTGTMPRSYLPAVVKHQRFAIFLVAIQTLLGASICCLSAWLLVWTPSLRRRDTPYWSGLPLLGSGTLGLLLLCCFRRYHPGTFKGYFITTLKICSVVLSLIAATASFIATVFALIHLLTLSAMICISKIQLNETCVCQMSVNSSYPLKSYHYADLKCPDVNNLFFILLIFSCVVNFLGGCISLWYVYLHCSTNYDYLYSKVRTKETKIVLSK